MKKAANKNRLPGMDATPAMLVQSYHSTKKEAQMSLTLRYEYLARWATEQWQQRHPNEPYMVLWASENCGNNLARQRVKNGRKLKGKVRYQGYQAVECPYVVSISDYRVPGRAAVLAETVGAFLFNFAAED